MFGGFLTEAHHFNLNDCVKFIEKFKKLDSKKKYKIAVDHKNRKENKYYLYRKTSTGRKINICHVIGRVQIKNKNYKQVYHFIVMKSIADAKYVYRKVNFTYHDKTTIYKKNKKIVQHQATPEGLLKCDRKIMAINKNAIFKTLVSYNFGTKVYNKIWSDPKPKKCPKEIPDFDSHIIQLGLQYLGLVE